MIIFQMLYLLPVLLPPSDTKSINATLNDKELVKHIEDKHFSCVWLIVLVIQQQLLLEQAQINPLDVSCLNTCSISFTYYYF